MVSHISPMQQTLLASCVAIDFVLVGNAITQSFMTLPSLIVDFPHPATQPTEYAARATQLSKAWPINWTVGNNLFRPLSTLSTVAHLANAVFAHRAHDPAWRAWALAAALHLGVLVHSALNMQPINDRLARLGDRVHAAGAEKERGRGEAVELAERWARWNLVRLVVPAVSGGLALWRGLLGVEML